MAHIFVVVCDEAAKKTIEERLNNSYPGEGHIHVGDSAWLVADEQAELPKTISDKIWNDDDNEGVFMVVPVAAYWGFHNARVWDWLKIKQT